MLRSIGLFLDFRHLSQLQGKWPKNVTDRFKLKRKFFMKSNTAYYILRDPSVHTWVAPGQYIEMGC